MADFVQTKGLRIGIVVLDVVVDRAFEIGYACERTAADTFCGDFSEPALHRCAAGFASVFPVVFGAAWRLPGEVAAGDMAKRGGVELPRADNSGPIIGTVFVAVTLAWSVGPQ